MDQKSSDAAKVKFFPPGIPLIAIMAEVVLDRVWPLNFIVPFSSHLR